MNFPAISEWELRQKLNVREETEFRVPQFCLWCQIRLLAAATGDPSPSPAPLLIIRRYQYTNFQLTGEPKLPPIEQRIPPGIPFYPLPMCRYTLSFGDATPREVELTFGCLG